MLLHFCSARAVALRKVLQKVRLQRSFVIQGTKRVNARNNCCGRLLCVIDRAESL